MNLKKMVSFDIGINEDSKEFLARQLTLILSDQYVLFTQLNSFHWNVRGKHFPGLHALFQKGYEMLFEDIDLIAERILQLGYFCNATLSDFLKNSKLKEQSDVSISDEAMVKILVENFEKIIVQMREVAFHAETNYKDTVTNNLIVDLLQSYEKYIWLLRSNIIN